MTKTIRIIFVFFLLGLFSNKAIAQKPLNEIRKKNEGFFSLIEIGYLSGFGDIKVSDTLSTINSDYAARLRATFGYFVNPRLSLGAGIGLTGHHGNGYDYNLLPIFLDVRGYLKDKDQTAFAFVELGYAPKLDQFFERGVFSNIGVGYKLKLRRLHLVPSVGLNFQRIENETVVIDFPFDLLTSSFTIKSVSFTLGILF